MTSRLILDTDIFSEVLKGKNENVKRRSTAYRQIHGHYTISVCTLTEMVKGYQKHNRHDRIDQLVQACVTEEVLLLDKSAAVIAGMIFGQLEYRGLPIGRTDPLIAAIALANDLTLATGNTKHFQRVVDLGFPLRLINWREP
jgi:tRNA(fMet)-specific endonuclease VapC